MTDVFLFIRHGWKSIWKQRTIWLFSVIPMLMRFYNAFQVIRPTDLLRSLISLTASLIFVFLYYVSVIGVLYLAYSSLIGKPVTIQETLSAVNRFFGRVVGCSCLGSLALSPVLFWVLIVSINSATHRLEISNKTIWVLLSLSIFNALFQFAVVGFFENDWGIRQSLDKAWSLFKSHFGVLAILGLILTMFFRVYSALSGALTVLIQSGFNLTSISTLNALNPTASLSKNLLFVLIDGIGQTVFTALNALVLISAYLRYNHVELPFQMRVR